MSLYFWGVFILLVILFAFSLIDETMGMDVVIILSFTSWLGLFFLCIMVLDRWIEYLEAYIFERYIIDRSWYLH